MSQIKVMDLSFCYEGSYDKIFEHVSFQIDTDWKLGFIGRNGKGKTTFLKLLQGLYSYEGTISANVDFDYFPFPVTDPSWQTIDVVSSVCIDYEYWELVKELSLLAVPEEVLYRPFATLSNGEQTKVLLAALFLQQDHFLLIDEPTNHLDLQARQIVGAYLKRKKGFILVSHDRALLDACVDHILAINRTDIEIMQGDFSTWWQQKQKRDQFALTENQRLSQEIQSLTLAAQQNAHWSDALEKTKKNNRIAGLRPDRGYIGHQAAKMMKRAKSVETRRQRAIEEKQGLLKNLEHTESLQIHPLSHYAHPLLELRDLSIGYGKTTVCQNISFQLEAGERLALLGRNGCGKSSVLKLVAGEQVPYQGIFRLASGLIVSYVPQDVSFLTGDLTTFAQRNQIDESLFKTILRKLDFPRLQFEKDMGDFSSGQKKKVLLACSLCQQAHIYLWDEPLNFIDVFSRMQLEELLLKYQPTMLLVEHDKAFVERVATSEFLFPAKRAPV